MGSAAGRVTHAWFDKIYALVFVVSSMLGMGLGLSIRQIATPLRNLRLVGLSVITNFILMPVVALVLARILRLDQPLGVGLLLLGAAAGAPFLPKLAQIARGNLAFAVGLMVLLMVVTVGYLPVVLPQLLPGVSVDSAKIARSLFGGPSADTRTVLGLGTAQRNIAAALVVGSQSFDDPNVVVMVVVVAIVGLLLLMPLSRRLAKHG
jgi:BASS family bile acid:Na+ symporter